MIEDISTGTPAVSTDRTEEQIHTFSYDSSHHQSIGVSIIQAVASVSDVDPLSLRPRLYDVVDPDALESLLSAETTEPNVRISFRFGAYTVTVTANGEIFLRENDTGPTR